MNILYPVVALNRDGTTELLYNHEEVCEFVRKRRVGATWELRTYRRLYFRGEFIRDYFTKSFDWILRDDLGRKLDPDYFPTTYSVGYWSKRWEKRQEDKSHAAEVGLPIPGTGKRKRRKCRCLEACSGNKRQRSAETVEENMRNNGFE
jgi:hypothetical protein